TLCRVLTRRLYRYLLSDSFSSHLPLTVVIARVMIFLAFFFFSSRRRHTRSVSAFLLNRSSDLWSSYYHFNYSGYRWRLLRDGRRWRSPSFSIASWPCY